MRALLIIALVLICGSASSQEEREFTITEGDTTYTMKKYFMVFLMRGDNSEDYTEEQLNELQTKHLEHINMLAEEGHVVLAGPFGDDTEMRGILLFDVESAEKAVELESEDPAVQAGRLRIEVHPWWGAKGTILK